MDLDFDTAVGWLDAQLGREVLASTQGAGDDAGNSRLTVRGPLGRADGDVMLVDARPGRVEAFTVGPATLVLLEGDFDVAHLAQLEGGAVLLQAVLRDLMVVVGTLPEA